MRPQVRIPLRGRRLPTRNANLVAVTLTARLGRHPSSAPSTGVLRTDVRRYYASVDPAKLVLRLARAKITPPDEAAYSFESSDNHLEWSLEVRIDIPGPDWTETRKLRMVPV